MLNLYSNPRKKKGQARAWVYEGCGTTILLLVMPALGARAGACLEKSVSPPGPFRQEPFIVPHVLAKSIVQYTPPDTPHSLDAVVQREPTVCVCVLPGELQERTGQHRHHMRPTLAWLHPILKLALNKSGLCQGQAL